MTATLKVTIDAWPDGGTIPDEYGFGAPDAEQHVALSANRSPGIRWTGAPEATRSFAIICHDPDVPSVGDDVNQEGKTVPADLPRADFFHWVLVGIPAAVGQLAPGADSNGVTPRGKPIGRSEHGIRGVNNYTDWFASDPGMSGDYGGYDGPCPPWNDERLHHYHFAVHALDVERLALPERFGGPEVRAAMEGHILAQGEWVGTYTLNPKLRGR